MQKEKNKVGVHTPALTTEVYNQLQEQGFKVDDLCWKNDQGDCLQINDMAIIWVPNEKIYSHYGYVPFSKTWKDPETGEVFGDQYNWDKEKLFKTREELFAFLQSLIS